MKIHSRILAFSFLAPILFGCHQEIKNDSWYMLHPQALQQEMMACEAKEIKDSQCEMVMRAGIKMTEIVNQQQDEPEKFGQSILNAQQELQQLKAELINAQNKVQELGIKNASKAELQTAQVDLDKAEAAYAEQLQQVNVMLAVLSMSGPT